MKLELLRLSHKSRCLRITLIGVDVNANKVIAYYLAATFAWKMGGKGR